MTTSDITARNRRAWDAIAPDRPPRPPEFFRAKGSTLDEPEAEALGDVTGLRVLHLQCANGNETLSLAAKGAKATGVDISAVAIDMARKNAEAAGLDARFVAADVYDLPHDLGVFDIVYTSAGAICWMPDLDAWAAIVASRLRQRGRFVLYEHHPLWEVLRFEDGAVTVDRDYFGAAPAIGTPAIDGVDHRSPLGANDGTGMVAFVWPVGAVVNALIKAGLRITELTERPEPAMYPDTTKDLPGTYLLRAVRD